MNARTMFDKIWDAHVVAEEEGEILLYVDRALIHEGSSHAFAALKRRGQKVARPQQVFAFTDHYVPTTGREKGIEGIAVDEIRNMVIAQHENTRLHGIRLFGLYEHKEKGSFSYLTLGIAVLAALVFMIIQPVPTGFPVVPMADQTGFFDF